MDTNSPNQVSSKKKNGLLLFVGILIIAGAVYLLDYYKIITLPDWGRVEYGDIHTFDGGVIKIKGNVVTLKGLFGTGTSTVPMKLQGVKEFSFQVTPETTFIKKEYNWPTWEEVERAPRGVLVYRPEPKEESVGSFNDLVSSFSLYPQGVHVIVDFSTVSPDSRTPVASSVFYEIISMPHPRETSNE